MKKSENLKGKLLEDKFKKQVKKDNTTNVKRNY